MGGLLSHKSGRLLLLAACLVISVAGLRAARDLLLPLLTAFFLALVSVPPMRRLTRYGIPSGLALAIVVTMTAVAILLVGVVVGDSLNRFYEALPRYRGRFHAIAEQVIEGLGVHGIALSSKELSEWFGTCRVLEESLASDTFGSSGVLRMRITPPRAEIAPGGPGSNGQKARRSRGLLAEWGDRL